LNATGQGWVSKTGSTKLALREGHDVIDSAFTGSNSQFNELKFRTAEYSGTSSDPILEVTYASSGPPAPTVIQDTTYTYDANGNVTQLVDASGTDTAKTVAYTYDDLNRLMSATATGVASGQQTYTYSYTYNAVGNILTRSESVAGGAAVTYTYAYEGNTGSRKENPHAVTKITPSTGSVVNYTYDNNGNLTTDGTWTHTWDYGNRLTGSSKTGVSVSYAYDHAGSRVKLVTPSKTTIVASPFYSKEGTQEVKYLLAGDGAVATIKGTGAAANAYIMHSDHLGSSSAISNNIGQLLELSDYFPYGGQRLNQTYNGFDDRKGYTGHEYDVDTGLNYAGSRYYNSAVGRWISQDPVFLALGNDPQTEEKTNQKLQEILSDPQLLNSYSYARNNPLIMIDQSGEWPSWGQIKTVAQVGWSLGKSYVQNKANDVKNSYNSYNAYMATPEAQQKSRDAAMSGMVYAGPIGGTDRYVGFGVGSIKSVGGAGMLPNGLKVGQNFGGNYGKVIESKPGQINEPKFNNSYSNEPSSHLAKWN
jgi:RHS repeat-associated protein